MQTIKHPHSGQTIDGVRLLPGTELKKGDKYDGARGTWDELGTTPGLIIQPGCTTIWVRQPGPLSENAAILLKILNSRTKSHDTIAQRHGRFYIIPKADFNWDGRFDLNCMQVRYPECVEELVDHGLLMRNVCIVGDWHPDFSECEPGGINCVWTLTVAGQQYQQSDAA